MNRLNDVITIIYNIQYSDNKSKLIAKFPPLKLFWSYQFTSTSTFNLVGKNLQISHQPLKTKMNVKNVKKKKN